MASRSPGCSVRRSPVRPTRSGGEPGRASGSCGATGARRSWSLATSTRRPGGVGARSGARPRHGADSCAPRSGRSGARSLRRDGRGGRRGAGISSRRLAACSNSSLSAQRSISSSSRAMSVSSGMLFELLGAEHVFLDMLGLLAEPARRVRRRGWRSAPRRSRSFTIVAGVMPCSSLYASWILAAAVRLVDRAAHRARDLVRVHDHAAVHVARRAPDRLDERGLAAQEALLVGVEDRDERRPRAGRGPRAAG